MFQYICKHKWNEHTYTLFSLLFFRSSKEQRRGCYNPSQYIYVYLIYVIWMLSSRESSGWSPTKQLLDIDLFNLSFSIFLNKFTDTMKVHICLVVIKETTCIELKHGYNTFWLKTEWNWKNAISLCIHVDRCYTIIYLHICYRYCR